jgi:NAD(P)-dependent dehydrogenase (short-subunit alcohol dehydrogenase family)
MRPLHNRVAIITGASRGIGRATAIALAEAGAHVVAISRTLDALQELDSEIRAAGNIATTVHLDLKDYDGLMRLRDEMSERYKKLDILIGNAGTNGPLLPISQVEPTTWEEVMAVNVTANWHLIRCMEPLLKRSDAGRAVFISSGLSWRMRQFWGPYAVSKAALNAMVRTWATENVCTSLRVNLFSPGPVRTRLRAMALPDEDATELETPDRVAEKILEMCLPTFNETGKLYSYPERRLMTFRAPE